MQHLGALFEIKAVDAGQRIIEGYASVFGNVDKVGDVMDPAAFTDTLRRKAPSDVAVFIGHQASALPVGEPLEIRSDGQGLFTKTLVLDGPVGDQLLSAARKGLLGMSIGYVPTASRPDTVAGKKVRRLTAVDLLEYSFAAKAVIANPAALVTAVKTEGAMDEKAEWTAAYINNLPDSAFAVIDAGGTKDEEGKTVPRSLRHFPHHDASGALDLPHLRNAMSRAPQSPAGEKAMAHLMRHARAEGMGTGKTDDAHDPVWAEGVAPALLLIAHDLVHLAERAAEQQKAMAALGDETKAGWMTRATWRQDARDLAIRLDSLIERAEGADTGGDAEALADWWRLQHDLTEVVLDA